MNAHNNINEILLETMVVLGGGTYKGIQAGFRNKHGVWVEALAYFNSPLTGTTLALSISAVSARAVRKHIAKSDSLFEQFKDKATANVFAQFGTEGV